MITKAEHNVVHELSGISALTCLQNVFGSLTNDERALAHRALHIGIAMDEHRSRFDRGDFLVRNLIGADQQTGAVVIGDVVQEGQTVVIPGARRSSRHRRSESPPGSCPGNAGEIRARSITLQLLWARQRAVRLCRS